MVELSHYVLRKASNAANILIRFCRKSHHVIEFDIGTSACKSQGAGLHQLFLGNVFVDDVSQTLGTCFGSKCQPRLTDSLSLF